MKLLKMKNLSNLTKRFANVVVVVTATVYEVYSGETANTAYIKKTLAKSRPIFKTTSSRLLSQDWFLYRDTTTHHHLSLEL
jgi:hypothetical protein